MPFAYSAEAYPLYIRDKGMSLATATTWGFNWLLAITWFALEKAFTTQGALWVSLAPLPAWLPRPGLHTAAHTTRAGT